MNNQVCSSEQPKQRRWTLCGYVMNEVDSGRVNMNIDSGYIKKQV